MSARTTVMLLGIALTPICLALAVWDHQGPLPVLFFPWSMYSMGLRRIALPYDSLGAPWMHEVVMAALQFPIYSFYVGRGANPRIRADRTGKLLMIHVALILLAFFALNHN